MRKFTLAVVLATTSSLFSAARGPSKAGITAVPTVKPIRVPNGGIQPQVVTDEKGTLHLVYFTGEPTHGDLFYVRSGDGGNAFSPPIRVNSQPGSAVAMGDIRGARIALGRNGKIHVAGNGSAIAEPKTSDGRAPMLYSRVDSTGKAFKRNEASSAPLPAWMEAELLPPTFYDQRRKW